MSPKKWMRHDWERLCEQLEDDIIECAVQVAFLKTDRVYYSKDDDAFAMLTGNDVDGHIDAFRLKLDARAKQLLRARAMAAPGRGVTGNPRPLLRTTTT